MPYRPGTIETAKPDNEKSEAALVSVGNHPWDTRGWIDICGDNHDSETIQAINKNQIVRDPRSLGWKANSIWGTGRAITNQAMLENGYLLFPPYIPLPSNSQSHRSTCNLIVVSTGCVDRNHIQNNQSPYYDKYFHEIEEFIHIIWCYKARMPTETLICTVIDSKEKPIHRIGLATIRSTHIAPRTQILP